MAGLLIEIIISGLLLYLVEKRSLSVLGLTPSTNRIFNFLFGFTVSAICCSVYFISIVYFSESRVEINEEYTVAKFFHGTWWTLRSVLFEEFLFRGALLFIAIRKLGVNAACIFSAVAFGVYHWFSYGIIGDPASMMYVFFVTGVAGLLFAYSYAATRSMYLPIALHFGWNLVTIIIFSQGPLGDQLLSIDEGNKLYGALPVGLFIFQVFALPIIIFWYLRRKGSAGDLQKRDWKNP